MSVCVIEVFPYCVAEWKSGAGAGERCGTANSDCLRVHHLRGEECPQHHCGSGQGWVRLGCRVLELCQGALAQQHPLFWSGESVIPACDLICLLTCMDLSGIYGHVDVSRAHTPSTHPQVHPSVSLHPHLAPMPPPTPTATPSQPASPIQSPIIFTSNDPLPANDVADFFAAFVLDGQ